VNPADTEFLYLTTTGRRTGQPREIEIWFTEREKRYYVIAEHLWETHWVQNLQAEPRVSVRVGNQTFAARGRVIDGTAEAELLEAIRELSEKKYGWGDGLVVEIDPDHAPASAPHPPLSPGGDGDCNPPLGAGRRKGPKLPPFERRLRRRSPVLGGGSEGGKTPLCCLASALQGLDLEAGPQSLTPGQ
jgi:deazaflavin-dependent oxidoreductase (nitroreductase family)